MMHQSTKRLDRTRCRLSTKRQQIFVVCLHKIVALARAVTIQKLADVIQKRDSPSHEMMIRCKRSVSFESFIWNTNDDEALIREPTRPRKQLTKAIETATFSLSFRICHARETFGNNVASFVGIPFVCASRLKHLLVQSSDLWIHIGFFSHMR